MGEHHEDGVLDMSYVQGRTKKKSLIYRLGRRTDEVLRSIENFSKSTPQTLLDLGCAEGAMTSSIKPRNAALMERGRNCVCGASF